MSSYYDKLNRLNGNRDSLSQRTNGDLRGESCESTRPSAFRAVNISSLQQIPANTTVKVLYPNIQFDLANEFNSAASMFIPNTRGVYSLIASLLFSPNNCNSSYRGRINIQVNGHEIAADNDFFGANIQIKNIISVSTIAQLKCEDIVEVFFLSNVAGTINIFNSISRFEGARFPSPAT
ncbi:hypothetical protein COE15_23455 [Bacillus cereus]|uniref:C1q domain-containing protein n=2 Tax=Bacillus TaxID=1386 RepID=A0ABS3NXQ0_9BACI|nr:MULTISPECIES: hypothetical protein [Bacillus]MBO1625716.1 hypothetical protein [Bacillus arachidis]PFE03869.1 hypothetical protein CN288_10665 [Bacillus sp. AFS023182]PGX93398.1 hypothetical protein COE15_23455 [Bacillus cereus]WIY59176.1 hypothetical protein QRY57_14785 [Bacillus arachidis]